MKLKSSSLLIAASIVYATIAFVIHSSSTKEVSEKISTEYINLTVITVPDFNRGVNHGPDYIERGLLKKETVSASTAETPKLRRQIPSDKTKRCPEFEHKFAEYGLPVELFSYIAWRESRCRIKAINAKFDSRGNVTWTLNKNGSIDRGLLQINSTWKTVTKNICGTDLEGLMLIECNLSVAKYLYNNGGPGHWGF
jgi:hypothetical protein